MKEFYGNCTQAYRYVEKGIGNEEHLQKQVILHVPDDRNFNCRYWRTNKYNAIKTVFQAIASLL